MTPELWELINWISNYYMTPLGQVAKTVFPKSLSTQYKSQKLWFVESRIDIDPLKFGKLKKYYLFARVNYEQRNKIYKPFYIRFLNCIQLIEKKTSLYINFFIKNL